MTDVVIVRYGELGLKSPPVRREFERMLQRNIVAQFLARGHSCRLRSDHGHLYVESDDPTLAATLARRVFGVTSVSVASETNSNVNEISALAVALAADRVSGKGSFAVRSRRTGNHPFSSQELARTVGGAMLERYPELKVDLEHPQLEVFVEVRANRTYVYFDRLSGPGGLPLGVAGSVIALVDGPRGALGAYLMMKRGCRASIVSTPTGERLAREVLAGFDPRLEVTTVDSPASWESSVDQLARTRSADGVVLPLSVDDYPMARERWGDRVIFSPTVGLTDPEVSGRWQNIESLLV